MLSQAQLLECEANVLKSKVGECIKARDGATCTATEHSRQYRMPDACISLLVGKANLLKQKESIDCNVEVMRRRVADSEGDIKELAGGQRRDNFGSDASIQHNADQ